MWLPGRRGLRFSVRSKSARSRIQTSSKRQPKLLCDHEILEGSIESVIGVGWRRHRAVESRPDQTHQGRSSQLCSLARRPCGWQGRLWKQRIRSDAPGCAESPKAAERRGARNNGLINLLETIPHFQRSRKRPRPRSRLPGRSLQPFCRVATRQPRRSLVYIDWCTHPTSLTIDQSSQHGKSVRFTLSFIEAESRLNKIFAPHSCTLRENRSDPASGVAPVLVSTALARATSGLEPWTSALRKLRSTN